MKNKNNKLLSDSLPVPQKLLERRIYTVRGHQVMFDTDLAELYQVPTKRLNEAVRRNKERFPEDFMFQLNKKESENLRSQIATSSYGGRRYLPYAFTEHGVAMLSSVLNSYKAIQMNIAIIRAFVQLRFMLEEYKELSKQVTKIKGTQDLHSKVLAEVVQNLKRINSPSTTAIGFRIK